MADDRDFPYEWSNPAPTTPQSPDLEREGNGGWINAKENPPEVGEYVLVNCNTDTVMKGILKYDGWEVFWLDGINGCETVTHWMPLPTPPVTTTPN
jgi:hypothetical protein